MAIADQHTYLADILDELKRQWPANRTVNIVCHGHSVPAGYFATPYVDTFHSYPHLLHQELKQRFPFAVINIIVTAIGGETSRTGSERFAGDVLRHQPDVVAIDYGLNDRSLSSLESQANWQKMIRLALDQKAKVILLTPSWDSSYFLQDRNWHSLADQASQIRDLAAIHSVGLCDSFQAFQDYISLGGDLGDLLSQINHPNSKGHALIAQQLSRWFMACDCGYA